MFIFLPSTSTILPYLERKFSLLKPHPLFRMTKLFKLAFWICLYYFFILYFLAVTTDSSREIIKTLPGFNGTLPFVLETGYVSVGEDNDVELFYYFLESEKNPQNDPLILWLTGGPGCSGLSAFVWYSGPLHLDRTSTSEDLPTLVLNPNSWTRLASIIYIDSPVGTGFSYASSLKGYHSSNTKYARHVSEFIRKWMLEHPKFEKNPLYIGGDSYGGIFVPMVTLEIETGNKAGYLPHMSLQGYLVGNPLTDIHGDKNSRIPYAHRNALISDEYYMSAKSSCNGEYVNPDPNNSVCMFYLQLINECAANVNPEYTLGECYVWNNSTDSKWARRSLLQEALSVDISSPPFIGEVICTKIDNNIMSKWANDTRVRRALHIREGTKPEWTRCNYSLSFELNVDNVVEYHRSLSQANYQVLVYSGDHDLTAPYISTLSWIKSLNLAVKERWRPWFVDGQTAGYTEHYKKNGYNLTFATVKGAGHITVEYKPKETFAIIERWLSGSKL